MNTVFVYSATGNSFATAKQISEALDFRLVNITDELINQEFTCDQAVFVYPVYAYGVPKTCKRFILNNKFNINYLASVATVGSSAGGAHVEVIKLFKRKDTRVNYTKAIKSVENFVHMFKLPEEEKIARLVKNQRELTATVIAEIRDQKARKRALVRPESVLVSLVFRSVTGIFERRYKITQDCNGCGICARVCPANAIEMLHNGFDPTPEVVIHPKKCDHCQACMQLCPHRAIHFGRVTPDSRRYKHPDVTLKDLCKR